MKDEYKVKHPQDIFTEMLRALKNIGIPISKNIEPEVRINTRAKKRWGCCKLKNGMFSIEISNMALENEEFLKQVIAHELLHTCDGCQNHGKQWKMYAEKVNNVMSFEIERTMGEAYVSKSVPQYILKCERCKREFARFRQSKVVKYPYRYRCKCGGKLRRSK